MNVKSAPKRALFWSFVTAFGALWGGLELSLGTFLHTLHVPKTGLIMVSLSAILLVAQRQIYPARGSTIATALVAAAIKSLSPGGVVLGAMMGILTEALIVELVLFLRPRSFILSVFAGSAAVLWSQVQSVFKKWIYYGNDIWEIFYGLAYKIFGEQAAGWGVIALISAIIGLVLLIGGSAGAWGYSLGRRIRRELETRIEQGESIQACNGSGSLVNEEAQAMAGSGVLERFMPRSGKGILDERIIETRWMVLPIMLVSFGLQFSGHLWLAALSLLFVLGGVAFSSRRLLKLLWWPKFWIASFIISALGGIFLAYRFGQNDIWDFSYGLLASIRMLLRGAYVFALISWLTRCIRSEELLRMWSRVGLESVGNAVSASYTLLPLWLERLECMLSRRPKGGLWVQWRYVRHCLLECLIEASLQAQRLARDESEKAAP